MPENNIAELEARAANLEQSKAAFRSAVYVIQAEIVENNRKIREAHAARAAKKE